jgi:hypothetical protein
MYHKRRGVSVWHVLVIKNLISDKWGGLDPERVSGSENNKAEGREQRYLERQTADPMLAGCTGCLKLGERAGHLRRMWGHEDEFTVPLRLLSRQPRQTGQQIQQWLLLFF